MWKGNLSQTSRHFFSKVLPQLGAKGNLHIKYPVLDIDWDMCHKETLLLLSNGIKASGIMGAEKFTLKAWLYPRGWMDFRKIFNEFKVWFNSWDRLGVTDHLGLDPNPTKIIKICRDRGTKIQWARTRPVAATSCDTVASAVQRVETLCPYAELALESFSYA